MKIAFSTLGCPRWSWNEILATAKDLGFDGIEIRGIENEMHVPKAHPFLDKNINTTKQKLQQLNLEIPCLTSSCYLFERDNIEEYINEAKQYIDVANKLRSPYIRVLGDRGPKPEEEVDDEFVAQNLSELCKYSEGKNVKVLVETNGVYANSQRMLQLLSKIDDPNIGVLWDVHHPFRFMNESVEQTFNNIGQFIEHVHIKDSIIKNGEVKYKMMGCGDIPVDNALELLKKSNYKGYISLEWVKRWCIELEEPGIVFSHFANYIKKRIR